MSSKTQLQTNNAQLSSLIETLRGKAAGGGGASIETCTVTITSKTEVRYIVVSTLDPSTGEISYESVGYQNAGYSRTFENVVCGSLIAIHPGGAAITCDASGGITLVASYMSFVLSAPSEPGAIASALFYSNM